MTPTPTRLARFFPAIILTLALAMSSTHRQADAQADTQPGSQSNGQPAVDVPPLPDGLDRDFRARVVSVIDGDTVELDDGSEVRLIGLQAPKLALGRPGFVEWPLAPEAQAFLADLVEGRAVTVAFGGLTVDRYERRLGHLERDDGLWIQGAMLAAGMARVYSFPVNRTAVPEMLTLERAARAAGLGIWSDPYYAVLDHRDVERRHTDTYQLVRGEVLSVDRAAGRVYLNFGANYRTDFTLSVDGDDLPLFEEAGLDLFALEGRVVQARGWVDWRNGPMIDLTHPELLETID